MINPDDKQMQALAYVQQNVPAFEQWIETWAQTELARLPQALANVAVAQGRCQVLGELLNALRKAPENAAATPRQPSVQPRTPIGA